MSSAQPALPHAPTDALDLPNNMVAAVDIGRFPGDQPSGIAGKVCRRDAAILDRDQGSHRRTAGRPLDNIVEDLGTRSRAGLDRPGRDHMYSDTLGTQLVRQV